MCGIVGLWRWRGSPERGLTDDLGRMAGTLVHRGPDDEGVWCDAAAGFGLGFRRLAVLDLTPTGRQPMLSADGRYAIAFNGEIYNFADLRRQLEREGAVFRGTSDTEVILAGASRWGAEQVIPRLWGMFALAIWDRADRTLVLARDRFGKKPLFYRSDGSGLAFASELKALRAVLPECEVDRRALAAYFRYAYVPAPHTIYRGIAKLPPGCLAVVRAAEALTVRPYWSATDVAAQGQRTRRSPSDADATAELDALLHDAVRRRMVADVPVGVFLSGGIDSTVVAALMQAEAAGPVRTFTIGFAEADYDEAPAGRAVARHLGTDHAELRVTPEEARAVVPRLPEVFDEPFGDASGIPTMLVSRLARDRVTVALSGDGGDELFGGYVRYLWADRIWRRAAPWPAPFRRMAGRALGRLSPAAARRIVRALTPLLPAGQRQAHPEEKLAKFARLLGSDSPGAVYRSLISQWPEPLAVVDADSEASVTGERSALDVGGEAFVERMMLQDLVTYLPDDILVKLDRATMSASLEARAPLLDHRILEWVWRLPLRYRCRDGQGKWLLRQVLARYVPPALVDRPKTGFGVPIGDWLRGPLRDWGEALIDERRLRAEGYLRAPAVRAVWADHLAGRQDESRRLWVVLMFQAWLERWVTAGPAGSKAS